ncbi:hypothetical protein DAI22_10g057200 [Oryza sativa Japonica Group]|nr:hypothetical protein DAI22_10g057200 [Oryza sativa Japonica Group]
MLVEGASSVPASVRPRSKTCLAPAVRCARGGGDSGSGQGRTREAEETRPCAVALCMHAHHVLSPAAGARDDNDHRCHHRRGMLPDLVLAGEDERRVRTTTEGQRCN